MRVHDLHEFHRGWFIGDFEPSVFKTKDFEVALITHYEGEDWPEHIHKKAYEYNVLVSGSMTVNNTKINPNTVFIIEPGESCKAIFHTNCKILCVKTPSIPGDKYEV